MGISFHSSARVARASLRSKRSGKYIFMSASLIDKGMAVLFISCDVNPKCMNSLHFPQPSIMNLSFRKYSIAFIS